MSKMSLSENNTKAKLERTNLIKSCGDLRLASQMWSANRNFVNRGFFQILHKGVNNLFVLLFDL